MSRFARLQRRPLLVPYIVAGDYGPGVTVPAMHALAAAGADIIELGYPFSEPMSEGASIQKAHHRALAAGCDLAAVLEQVALFREKDDKTPVVLMGYVNPVEQFGYGDFAASAKAAGVDGLLLVDLCPSQRTEVNNILKKNKLEMISLISPTTTKDHAAAIAASAGGYLYYISLRGVTGAGGMDLGEVEARLADLRKQAGVPVCVGFGIREPGVARKIGAFADGVVIGSLLTDKMEELKARGAPPEEAAAALGDLLATFRKALDN